MKFKYIFGIIFIILILLIVFIIIKKKNKTVENFQNPAPTFKDIILELTCTEQCPISYQFLYGCCKEIQDIINGDLITSLSPSTSNLIFQKKTVSNSACQGTNSSFLNIYDNIYREINDDCLNELSPNKLIYPSINYNSSDSCKKINYYKNNICVKSKDSTYYYLNKIFNKLNDNFNTYSLSSIDDENLKFENKNLRDIDAATIIQNYNISNIDELFGINFQISIKMNNFSNNNLELPYLKLKIPKRLKLDDTIDYEERIYGDNINNIDQIMEFLYKNVVISIDNKTITLFDSYYPDKPNRIYSELNFNLYNDFRKVTRNDEYKFSPLKKNYIREIYIEYKSSEEIPTPPFDLETKIHFIHLNETERNKLLDEPTTSNKYFSTRPVIYWNNIKTLKSLSFSPSYLQIDTSSNTSVEQITEDIEYLLIIIRDENLKEYYNDNNKEHDLIYWFAWNIRKDLPGIQEKEDLDKPDNYLSELYPYQYFDKNVNQFHMYSNPNDDEFNIINAKCQIIELTEDENSKLNNYYNNFINENNLSEFYKNFFSIIDDNSSTALDKYKIKYKIKEELKNEFDIYQDNNNLFMNTQITVLNYGESVYDLKPDEDKFIKLAYKGFYKIIFNNEEIICTIDNNQTFINYEKNNVYYIPYKTDRIKLNTDKDTKVIIMPSHLVTNQIIWKYLKSEDNDKLYNLTLNKKSKFILNFNCANTISEEKLIKFFEIIKKKNFYSLITTDKEDKVNIQINGDRELTNGTITFLPDDFDYDNYIEEIKTLQSKLIPLRINYKKDLTYDCQNGFPKQQILPTINIKLQTDINKNNYYYALEVYYLNKDNEKKPLYLEWDIDVNNEEVNIEFNGFKNKKLETNYLTKLNSSVKHKDNMLCISEDKIDNFIVINNINSKRNSPYTLKKLFDSNRLVYKRNETNKFYFTCNDKTYYIEKNLNINKWQIWHEGDGYERWVANQKNVEPINNKFVKWLFSPEFKNKLDPIDTNEKFDFFDFPNQFNKEKEINIKKNKFLLEVNLKFIFELENGSISNDYNCFYETQDLKTHPSRDENKYKTVLKSTIFNLPNISEKDFDLNKVLVFTETNEIKLNLNIYAKIHLYSNIRNNRVKQLELHQETLNNYSNILDKIEISEPNFSSVQKNILKQEILTHILINNANKNFIPYQNYFNTEILDNKVFFENRSISNDLYEKFIDYVTGDNDNIKINYSSYGNLGLRQDETLIQYILPDKINCSKLDLNKLNNLDNNLLKKIRILSKLSIEINSKTINEFINKLSSKSLILTNPNTQIKKLKKFHQGACIEVREELILDFNKSFKIISKIFVEKKELLDEIININTSDNKSKLEQINKILNEILEMNLNVTLLEVEDDPNNKKKTIECSNKNINTFEYFKFEYLNETIIISSDNFIPLLKKSLRIIEFYFIVEIYCGFLKDKILNNNTFITNHKNLIIECLNIMTLLLKKITEADNLLLNLIKNTESIQEKTEMVDMESDNSILKTKDVIKIYSDMIFNIFN